MNRLILCSFASLLVFSGCSTKYTRSYSRYPNATTSAYSENTNNYSSGLSAKAYNHPTMRPYSVYGVKYYPHDTNVGDTYQGKASWYGPDFHGKLTSNGEKYNMYDMTAAHKTLPMNTMVKVTNLKNGLSTVVRINDRGPFVATRIIDLSNTAAKKLDMIKHGTAPVKLEVLGFYAANGKKIVRKKKVYRAKTTKDRKEIGVPVKKPVLQAKKAIITKKGSYALQIGSFTNFDGAVKTQERYHNVNGYSAIIKDIDTKHGRFFKVLLKGFSDEKEARDYKLDSELEGAFIVKI